jgi:hypothetical protein
MMRPGVRAKLEVNLAFHDEMAKAHTVKAREAKKRAMGEDREQVEMYRPAEQAAGEEVADDQTDSPRRGSETGDDTMALAPEHRPDEERWADLRARKEAADADEEAEDGEALKGDAKVAKIHREAAEQLRAVLRADDTVVTIGQVRDQLGVVRDPRGAAATRRAAISRDLQSRGTRRRGQGLNPATVGRA